MSPSTVARLFALGRVAIGTAMVAAPEKMAATWVGSLSERAGAQTLTSAVGARDIALGAGLLATASDGSSARPWVLGAALGDAVDLMATLRGRDELPDQAVKGIVALAGASALTGLWLAAAID
jgi:hypothetical protein